jgi:excisionase family DNA binding protein
MNREQAPSNTMPSKSNSITLEDNRELIDPLWTVEDVAVFLKLQPETIRSMARRGELPAVKLGKVWRFKKGAIHAMMSDQD